MKTSWPHHVGIINMEIYFPSQYVDQSELEIFDESSIGKYTIGLGQLKMGFCSDVEDINSLCLTVVDNLMSKTPNVGYGDIGCLHVGTETIVDKSKSVKSVLMKLFQESGNNDVEGIDSTNACYGGTAALFNCINWIESSYWDGRLALAVAADIAVYSSGNARPTGGAGAVAMLIGPNAGLVFDRGLRASYVSHVYDFYKPNLGSEYPVVDGKLSIECYLQSLDQCYQLYKVKVLKNSKEEKMKNEKENPCTSPTNITSFDAILFHTPFCKLVQKSLARLSLNDYVSLSKETKLSVFPELKEFLDVKLETSYFDKNVEKAFMSHSLKAFQGKTQPSLEIASNVGNMYTSSLYGGLVSYLYSRPTKDLIGSKVALFSYGSGLASSFFSAVVTERVELISYTLSDVRSRLQSRVKVSPQVFSETMSLREKTHHKAPYTPRTSLSILTPGTWYLKSIDSMHRRVYEKIH